MNDVIAFYSKDALKPVLLLGTLTGISIKWTLLSVGVRTPPVCNSSQSLPAVVSHLPRKLSCWLEHGVVSNPGTGRAIRVFGPSVSVLLSDDLHPSASGSEAGPMILHDINTLLGTSPHPHATNL